MARILGLGTVVVDLQLIVERHPARDSKAEAFEARTQIGGPVPTALALLRRFGHSCRLHGIWGDDPHGRMIEDDLFREGIDFDAVRSRTSVSGTGTAHVWVERDSGHRTIVCHRAQPTDTPQSCTDDELDCCDAVHLDGWPGPWALDAARRAAERGKLVSLDAGSPRTETGALLENVTLLNCPRSFVRSFLGTDEIAAAGRELLSRGPKWVTITDGRNGAWIFTRQELHHQPAFAIDAVDTTGAGDVFSGALLHAALQPWRPRRMVEFASACAAHKCARWGNRAALPTPDDVDE